MRLFLTRFALSLVWAVVVFAAVRGGINPTEAPAADWAHLRGPAFNGSAPEEVAPVPWAESGPSILWKRPLGQGYSGFTLSGGRAYTLYQSAFSQNLVCLDPDSGETLWEYACGAPFEPLGLYPGPRSTPTLAAGRALFVTPDAVLYCVDAQQGERRWSVNLKEMFAGRGTEFGYSASPLVLDGKVILPVGGPGAAIVAFSLESGAVLWKSGSQPASYASIVPIRLEGRTLLLAAMRNHLLLLDPAAGRIVWESEVSHGYDEHSISPLYEEPVLVLTAPFKAGATAYRLSLKGTATTNAEGEGAAPETPDVADQEAWGVRADHLWHTREFSNDVLASAIVDGTIYGFDLRDQQAKVHRPSRGLFRCLDLPTGKTLWSSDRPGHSNVLAVDDKLLLLNDEGELVLLRANRERYDELARHSVFQDEICWTFPALSDGRAFLRTQSRAAALLVGSPPTGNPAIASSPLALPGRRPWSRLRLGMLLGGEREHPFMQPAPDELSRWFWWSLAVVALPACSWAHISGLWRRWRSPVGASPVEAGGDLSEASPNIHLRHMVEAGLWIGLGLVMTPVLNLQISRLEAEEGYDPFILTWPAALFGGLLLVSLTSRAHRVWLRRGGDAAFLLLCLFYFLAMRSQSLPHEWAFLIGLVPAIPFAWAWGRFKARSGRDGGGCGRALIGGLLATLGFSALFWTPWALRLLRGNLEIVGE